MSKKGKRIDYFPISLWLGARLSVRSNNGLSGLEGKLIPHPTSEPEATFSLNLQTQTLRGVGLVPEEQVV